MDKDQPKQQQVYLENYFMVHLCSSISFSHAQLNTGATLEYTSHNDSSRRAIGTNNTCPFMAAMMRSVLEGEKFPAVFKDMWKTEVW